MATIFQTLPRLLAIGLCVGLFAAYTPAHAATHAENVAAFNQAYAQLLDNPNDVKLTLRYAELAVTIGDYESAIPPLERLLITNPDQPKLKLELGILYFLLGSKDAARGYLQDAKTTAKAGSDIPTRADKYLQRL